MPTATSANRQDYQIGRQGAISIASGNSASSANIFIPVDSFSAKNTPKTFDVPDGMGNRSSLAATVIQENKATFSGGIMADPIIFGQFLYSAFGSVVTVDLGGGAYQHTFACLNSVIMPPFTLFYSRGAEGQKRMIGCQIDKLNMDFKNEGRIKFDGMSLGEDSNGNQAGSITASISAINYQNGSQLIRYTFSGTPDFSLVKNGDRLVVTGATANINNGEFLIVNIDNTTKYLDVINIDSATANYDQIAAAGSGTITRFTVPVYTTSVPMMKWMSEWTFSTVNARIDTEFLQTALVINSITNTGGISTYTLSNGDLSNVLVGDTLMVSNATSPANNGTFNYNIQQAQGGIVEVNNLTKTIKIANSNGVAQVGTGGTLSIKPKVFGCKDFSLSFENKSEAVYDSSNSPNIGVIIQKQNTLKSKMSTLNIASLAKTARAMSDSGLANFRFRYTVTNTLQTIGNGLNPKIEFILPKTKAMVNPKNGNNDASGLDWELTSIQESTFKIIVTNTQPTYPL